MPSRLPIRCTSWITASALPQVSSSPPVISFVMIPCSQHSIAKAVTHPVEMESSTYCAWSWLTSARALRSLTPQSEPDAASVSYSGPPYLGVTPSSFTSTSRLHATAHA